MMNGGVSMTGNSGFSAQMPGRPQASSARLGSGANTATRLRTEDEASLKSRVNGNFALMNWLCITVQSKGFRLML
jgi:hypothetical protein